MYDEGYTNQNIGFKERKRVFIILNKKNANLMFFVFCLCWKKSQFLSNLDVNTLYIIFPLFKLESFGQNETIFKKGECLTERSIIVLEGNIFWDKDENYTAVRNDILYEKELVFGSNTVLVVKDLIAFPEALILTWTREKIRSALGGKSLSEIVSSNTKKNTSISYYWFIKTCWMF